MPLLVVDWSYMVPILCLLYANPSFQVTAIVSCDLKTGPKHILLAELISSHSQQEQLLMAVFSCKAFVFV